MKTTPCSWRKAIAATLFLAVAFIAAAQGQVQAADAPRQIVLTYQDDPRTGITVTWRTDSRGSESVALFSKDGQAPLGEYSGVDAGTFTFEGTSAWIHAARLTNLSPGQTYWVVCRTDGVECEKFCFRTAPDDSRDITFVIGADAQHLQIQMPIIRKIFAKAAQENPDFFVYSGDFVNAELSEYEWDLFFDMADELLITDEGRRIPLVPAPGNHEVVNGYGGNQSLAPFYYHRFQLPDPENYYAITYGPDLLVVSLDSNHTAPIEGAQTAWLKDTLERYKDMKWKIVHYHDGSWWANEAMYVKMRAFWVPLFEEYGVDFVHNGHSHSYKRSCPLFNIGKYSGEIDGIVEEGLARARKDFDPTRKYAPPLQKNLMKLSRGDWKSTGYSSLAEGLKDMVYMLSLYVIQTGGATKEKVYDQISTTQLYIDYWKQVLSPGNKDFLTDPARGVVYLVGGGLGATMDYGSEGSPYWWILADWSRHHYRKVTLDVSENAMRIEPKFYDPASDAWELKDTTEIRR